MITTKIYLESHYSTKNLWQQNGIFKKDKKGYNGEHIMTWFIYLKNILLKFSNILDFRHINYTESLHLFMTFQRCRVINT